VTAPQDPFSTPPQGPGGTPPPGPPTGQPAGYGAPLGQPAGYGAPAGGPPPYGQQPGGFGAPGGFGGHGSPKNGFGIAALVLGILALVTCFTVVGGILLGLAAIVFGVLGRGRAKKGLADNGGMALAGLILGLLGLLASVAIAAAVGSVLSRGDFGNLTECLESAGQDQAAIDECSAEFEDSVTG
jgi:hypothetical protein